MNVKILNDLGITYDDLLIVPQYSEVSSRTYVDTITTIAGMKLRVPIIAANMDTICELEMARAMSKLGGLGILHRFASAEEQVSWVKTLSSEGHYAVPSVGVETGALSKITEFFDAGADAVCIDVAHANTARVFDLVNYFYQVKKYSDRHLIVGNFATSPEFVFNDRITIKIGVGPGSACETRVVAGVGVPQASAILSSVQSGNCVIADGGIKKPADVAKAIALGAKAVMVGGYLAGSDEVPQRGKDKFRGMASSSAQLEHRGRVSNDVAEGKTFAVSSSGPVKEKIEKLVGGLRSAMSYSGAHNVLQYQSKVVLQKVSNATLKENVAHFQEE